MSGSGTEDVVRIDITNMRFALWAGAQLKEITQGAIPALPADHCLDASAMNMMAARPNRHGERRVGSVGVGTLRHPKTPQPIDRIGAVDVLALSRWYRRIDPARLVVRVAESRCTVPCDVNAAIVARSHPGKHVVV